MVDDFKHLDILAARGSMLRRTVRSLMLGSKENWNEYWCLLWASGGLCICHLGQTIHWWSCSSTLECGSPVEPWPGTGHPSWALPAEYLFEAAPPPSLHAVKSCQSLEGYLKLLLWSQPWWSSHLWNSGLLCSLVNHHV